MENLPKSAKILAAISYVPFPPLFIVPMFAARRDSFAEFHSKQGLVLFLVWFGFWLIGLMPYLFAISFLGFVILIVAAILAIIQAWRGQRWEMPMLGKYAKKLRFE